MGKSHLIFETTDMQGVDIVLLAQQDWNTQLGSNCRNIAIEFAKRGRVLYVNPALDRITVLRNYRDPRVKFRRQVIRGRAECVVEVEKNLWVLYPDVLMESVNWLNSHAFFSMWNKRNNQLLSNSIRQAVNDLKFHRFVLFNDNEMFRGFYLKELLEPMLSVYYIRDYMLGVNYWRRHGRRFEPMIIAKSDLCLTNSDYLANYAKQFNANTVNVGQGCDPHLFMTPDRFRYPTDLADLTGLKIGYVGALDSKRLDLAVIGHIARSLPGCKIILVGPQDKSFTKSKLHNFSNVIFLGQKRQEDLAAYINAFDVCLNPQQVNVLTMGNYPRKIDEYLLLGKPVVATATEAMRMFSDYVYLARNKEEYVPLIEQALTEHSEEISHARTAFALTHTWPLSADRIFNAMTAYMDLTKL